jgi:glutamine---fructose-6-phosphate transaminase (isomerizing)
MDYLAAVHAQAQLLAAAGETIRAGLADLDLAPWRTGSLGVVAMGAAYHAAHAFVAPLRGTGRRVHLLSAAELLADPVPDLADAYLAVSQSGRSRETVAAMLAVAGRPRLGITAARQVPLAASVDAVLPMGPIDDSPIYTAGYTVTMQAYSLLAGALGVPARDPRWEAVPDMVERVLAHARPAVARLARRLSNVPCVDFVGQGAHLAAAAEGALLLREGARLPSACMDTYQYLHGPMEPLDDGLACIAFGDGREVELARAVAATGAAALLVTTAAADEAENLAVLRLPMADPGPLAVLEILPIQLLTWELAQGRGLGIEGFRYQQADTKLEA